MIKSAINAVDTLNDVASDLAGASEALSYKAAIDGDNLSSMLSRAIDMEVDAVREVSAWLEENMDLKVTD